MALSDELLEQIDAYLSGQLTTGEKDRFEARMRQDAGLRNEVAIQREIKEGFWFMAQKEQFRAMHADLDGRDLRTDVVLPPVVRPKRIVFRAQWAYFALAAVLVLGLGWVTYQNQLAGRAQLARNTRTFDAFFPANPKPAPAPTSDPDRVAASPTDRLANVDSVRLRVAVGALQRQQTSVAIDKLSVLARAAPGHWSASAQWYLALAYLKTNQRQKANELAKQMAGLNGHPYQWEATRLRSQLSANPSEPR